MLPPLVLSGTLGLAIISLAATAGTDSADQSAYSDKWADGSNGGSGFNPWKLTTVDSGGNCGFFLGDSKSLASGSGGDINSGGKSFGMFGQGKDNRAEAYRGFAAPLAKGQSASVDIAVNYRNGQKGDDLRGTDDKTLFNLNIGADDYIVYEAATGTGSIGSDYSNNTVFKLSFEQTSDSGGTWTVTRSGGISKTATGTYTGVAAGLKFYVLEAEKGSENDFCVNHLATTGAP